MNTNTTDFNPNNKFFIGKLKRKAQDIFPLQQKLDKAIKAKEEAQKTIESLQEEIADENKSIKDKTGYTVQELIKRVVTPTGKYDKNGQEIKKTDWELIYPDTVIPVAAAVDNTQDPVNYASPVTTEEPEEYLTEKAEAEEAYHNSDDYAQVAADYSREE